MTRETDPALGGAAAGHHESHDRRGDGDRAGSGGDHGPRYAFRAPVAVRPDDIASAIADVVARAVVEQRTDTAALIADIARYNGTAGLDFTELDAFFIDLRASA